MKMYSIEFKQLNHLNNVSDKSINQIKRDIRSKLGHQIYFESVKSEGFYRIYNTKQLYLQDLKDREIYNSIGEIKESDLNEEIQFS